MNLRVDAGIDDVLENALHSGTFAGEAEHGVLRPDHHGRPPVRQAAARQRRLQRHAGIQPDVGASLAGGLYLALQEIGFPYEVRDEAVCGVLVDLPRRADLQDAPRGHDRDAIRHRQRLLLVVGDEDEGDAGLVLHALELDLHLLAQLVVERGKRLVEEKHLGAGRQRAGKGDALRLAARDLVGAAAARASICTSRSMAATRAVVSLFGRPSISRPKATFCATVRCGNSA